MLYDRFLISIIIVIIVLTSVAFNEVTQQVSDLMNELENSLYNEKRYMDMVQLASNARSMINVANDIEFLMFDSRQLQ
jgi:type II secretory pathway pseudopilin PulG